MELGYDPNHSGRDSYDSYYSDSSDGYDAIDAYGADFENGYSGRATRKNKSRRAGTDSRAQNYAQRVFAREHRPARREERERKIERSRQTDARPLAPPRVYAPPPLVHLIGGAIPAPVIAPPGSASAA